MKIHGVIGIIQDDDLDIISSVVFKSKKYADDYFEQAKEREKYQRQDKLKRKEIDYFMYETDLAHKSPSSERSDIS